MEVEVGWEGREDEGGVDLRRGEEEVVKEVEDGLRREEKFEREVSVRRKEGKGREWKEGKYELRTRRDLYFPTPKASWVTTGRTCRVWV